MTTKNSTTVPVDADEEIAETETKVENLEATPTTTVAGEAEEVPSDKTEETKPVEQAAETKTVEAVDDEDEEEIEVGAETTLTAENFYQVKRQSIKNKERLVAAQTENEALKTEVETLKKGIEEAAQKIVIEKILSEYDIPEQLREFLPTTGSEETIREKAALLADSVPKPKNQSFNPTQAKGGSNSSRKASGDSFTDVYRATRKK